MFIIYHAGFAVPFTPLDVIDPDMWRTDLPCNTSYWMVPGTFPLDA